MPRRPRVFISSTMDDLANERRAVAEQAVLYNFEPVWAEALHPNGTSSWQLLEDEIRGCDILVLLLGDRYGWTPEAGYGAGLGKAVTHLEFDVARDAELTILPFFKRLRAGAKGVEADEARRRDEFRKIVGDWVGGQFRGEFDLAGDLSKSAGGALLGLLTDGFWKARLRARAGAWEQVARSTAKPRSTGPSVGCLFAGAGLSVAAGYPTAAILAELLGRRLGLDATGADLLSRYTMADVAAVVEERLGRGTLVEAVRELLDTPLQVVPTDAHLQVVRRFGIIITTNYDPLFERACEAQGISFAVRTPGFNQQPARQPDVTIYKLDGSVDDPQRLVLTNTDALEAVKDRHFWEAVEGVLASEPLVIMGHSLRDPTSRRLVGNRNRALSGVYVSPYLSDLDQVMLHTFALQGVRAMPTDYLGGR